MPPHRRNVGLVFQNYALFPHMDVRRNIEFGQRMRAIERSERERRVNDALELVRLGHLAERAPGFYRWTVGLGRRKEILTPIDHYDVLALVALGPDVITFMYASDVN